MNITDTLLENTLDRFVKTYKGNMFYADKKKIFFQTDGIFWHSLEVYRKDGAWHPSVINHAGQHLISRHTGDGFPYLCPFCSSYTGGGDMCPYFSSNTMIQTVANHPKIRLSSLFI